MAGIFQKCITTAMGEKMRNSHVQNIAGRYVLIVAKLAEMAGANLIVGDLVRAATRNCLIAMHAAGAESCEIRRYVGSLISEQMSASVPASPRALNTWVNARNHMEFLLFIEEHDELAGRAGFMPPSGARLH